MNREIYFDKMMGCWLGKNIGGTIGAPVEGRRNPVPLPLTFPTANEPNDDLDLQLVWLDMLNRKGVAIAAADFADCWINHIVYPFDEYGICVANLKRGLRPPQTGYYNNYFKDCMGSPIRSEIWACLCPARPAAAAWYALQDAQLDHYDEGVYGEIFFAAIESMAFSESDIVKLTSGACAWLPPTSKVREAIELTLQRWQSGTELMALRDELVAKYADANFSHAVINLAFTMAGVLYGEMDFLKSMVMAVNLGFDTDCTGATAGAIVGIVKGFKAINAEYQVKFDERIMVGWGAQDIKAPSSITEMTEQIMKLNTQFEAMRDKPALPLGYELPTPTLPPDSQRFRAKVMIDGRTGDENNVLAAVAAGNLNSFQPVALVDSEIIDLERYRNINEVYVLTEVRLPEPGKYRIMAMSAAAVKMWFNGIAVGDYGVRDFAPSPHRCGDQKVREFAEVNVQVLVKISCAGAFPARVALTVANEKSQRVVEAGMFWDEQSAVRRFNPLAIK